MTTPRRIKILLLATIFYGAVGFSALGILIGSRNAIVPPAIDSEIMEIGASACFGEITVLAVPTYGVCDAQSCVATACPDPRNCPQSNCTSDTDCKETPPAKKYKSCQSNSCAEKICPDQNNCPANSCSADTDCASKEEDKGPECKELLATPKKGTADLKVRFSVDATGDNLEEYQFDFDDGETMDSPNDTVYHTYKKGGNFTASVKIIDGEGRRTERDDCTAKVKVEEETHMACQNSACVEVSGSGENSCTNNLQCQTGAATHLECRASSCVTVSGSGANSCLVSKDCVTTTEPVTQIPVTGDTKTVVYAGLASLALIFAGVFSLLKARL